MLHRHREVQKRCTYKSISSEIIVVITIRRKYPKCTGFIIVFDLTGTLCHARMWLAHIGIITLLSTLLIKIWRLQDVSYSNHKRMRFQEKELVLLAIMIISILLVYLSMLSTYLPPYKSHKGTIQDNQQEIQYPVCVSYPNDQYRLGLYVLEGVCVCAGLVFGWMKKDYLDAVGEANNISKGTVCLKC